MTKKILRVDLYVLILASVLLTPTLTMPFINHKARQTWENRNLTNLPQLSKALSQPQKFFSQLDNYIDDHIGGGFQVIKARRKFYFDAFGATNDTFIVGNNDGDYFLTSPFLQKNRENPFAWWQNACVSAQSSDHLERNIKRFEIAEKHLSKYGAMVIFGMVPTKAVLLNDRLPISTPKKIKDACQQITVTNNWAANYSKLNPKINFFYPIETFKAHITDPLFYPNTAYHWQGESTWIWAEELAKKYHLNVSPLWDSTGCKPKKVPWDIGKLIGVGQETNGCDRNLSQLEIKTNSKFLYPIEDNKNSIEIVKMINPHDSNGKTAIIFSNSFGPAVREQIASHFKTTYHLRSGVINEKDMHSLLSKTDILNVDYVFVTIADFHYPTFLNWVEPK